jgi:two-component system CheB/CheR fusion protein
MSSTESRGPKATVTSLKPNPQPNCRVLVVEDNLDSVHSMAALIKMMGHEVEFAINGFAAMDIARRFKPDFILLDIGLPDFQGDKIARQLKYEPGLERTRMIAITGLPLAQVKARALEAGCEAVYAKPIAPTLLEELLAKPQRSD